MNAEPETVTNIMDLDSLIASGTDQPESDVGTYFFGAYSMTGRGPVFDASQTIV